MITKTRNETEMPELPSFWMFALLQTLPGSTICRIVACSSAYGRTPTHVHRCTEQHFGIDGVGENVICDPHKIKIDDDCELVCSCTAIPLPFIPLNKISPSQCLIGETDKLSQTNEVRIDEAVVSKVLVHCADTTVSVDGSISPMPDPAKLKLIAKSGDSGCMEGSSLSTTRGDDSNSEASISSSDNDETDEPTYEGAYVTHLEATDDDQSPPSSLDESTPNNGVREIVIANNQPCIHNYQATGIPTGHPPKAPAKQKKQVTGKSRTKQQKELESAVEPIEETACRSMGACDIPAPSQPPFISSDSEGIRAEEDGAVERLINGAVLPNQSSQDQDESTGATTTSVGEPPTEVEMHGEQDFTMVTARPGTFPGGDILVILQMFVMEPQSPPQPEMWHLPVQESEEGRNEPSKLVHGHITWNIK